MMRLRKLRNVCVCLFVLVPAAAAAESMDLQALYELVKAQGEKIDALTSELAATKAQLASTQEEVEITEERLASTVEFVEEQTAGSGSGANWWERTSIGGYGEVHYNNVKAEDSERDFKETDIHRYVLFVNHEFNDRVRFFSELEIEHGLVKDTADGSGNGEVEVEQAYVELDLNENHQAKAGLFLLPVGILNETHEPPTFYGVERNDVESILLPSTWWENGVGFSGQYESGLSWDFAVHSGLKVPTDGSNAFRIRSGRQKSSNASAEDLAYTGRIAYSGIPGLQLAASFQRQSDMSQVSGDGLDEGNLITAHAIYNNGGFQLRALWADWDIDGNEVALVGGDEQSGWYVEPSYRFNTPSFDLLQSVGVYTRFQDVEGVRIQDQFQQWEVGMNFWPTDNVVFKVDYRDREHDLSEAAGRDFKAWDLGVGFQF
jgi:hypothetical protein